MHYLDIICGSAISRAVILATYLNSNCGDLSNSPERLIAEFVIGHFSLLKNASENAEERFYSFMRLNADGALRKQSIEIWAQVRKDTPLRDFLLIYAEPIVAHGNLILESEYHSRNSVGTEQFELIGWVDTTQDYAKKY